MDTRQRQDGIRSGARGNSVAVAIFLAFGLAAFLQLPCLVLVESRPLNWLGASASASVSAGRGWGRNRRSLRTPPFLQWVPRGGDSSANDDRDDKNVTDAATTMTEDGTARTTATTISTTTSTGDSNTEMEPEHSTAVIMTTTATAATTMSNDDEHGTPASTTSPTAQSSTPSAFTNNATTTSSSNTTTLLSITSPAASSSSWKENLPLELQQKNSSFHKLRLGSVDIYLLGTAHVSNDSSREVQLLLESVQPQAIFVELCEARIPMLEAPQEQKHPATTNINNTKESFWDRLTTIQQSQGGSRLQALSTLLLTSVQEDYAKELNVTLGGEFQCACAYWKSKRRQQQQRQQQQQQQHLSAYTIRQRLPAPHLILGDRPLQLTLVRAWESLWWWPKLKVILGLVWSSWHKTKPEELRAWLDSVLREESDVLTKSFEELKRHFPTLYETIVAERDAWLAAKLVQTCRGFTRNSNNGQEPSTLVAIVGAGHVPGICQWLTNSTMNNNKSPEQVLGELVTTKRWEKDDTIQKEAIPIWIEQVVELQDLMPDQSFAWAQPTPAI